MSASINWKIKTGGPFYPVSLKRKSPDDLKAEVKQLKILWIADVRRPFSQSAPWYRPERFRSTVDIPGSPVVYIHAKNLANRHYRKRKEDYLNDVRHVLEKEYDLKWYPVTARTAFVCYCTDEMQRASECHATWLCEYLNPLFEGIPVVEKFEDLDQLINHVYPVEQILNIKLRLMSYTQAAERRRLFKP